MGPFLENKNCHKVRQYFLLEQRRAKEGEVNLFYFLKVSYLVRSAVYFLT